MPQTSLRLNKIFSDSFYTAFSFFVSAVTGLISVSLIANQRGLEVVGILAVLKMLSLTGLFGAIDPAISDNSAYYTAGRDRKSDNGMAFVQLTKLLLYALLLGLCSCISVVIISHYDGLFGAGGDFSSILYVWLIILAFIMLFQSPSLVIEGVLRGRQEFKFIRILEVVVAFFCFIGFCFVLYFDFSDIYFGFVYLAGIFVKTFVYYFVFIKRLLPEFVFSLNVKEIFMDGEFNLRIVTSYKSRFFSTLQSQLPVLILGFYGGYSAVGLFDIISKIPKFVKSACGFVSANFISYGSKLVSEYGASKGFAFSGQVFLLSQAALFPMLVLLMSCSPLILHYWMGADYVQYWGLLYLLLFVPLCTVIIASVNSSLAFNINYLKCSANLSIFQFFLQLALTFIALEFISDYAVYFGWALAVALTGYIRTLYIGRLDSCKLGYISKIYSVNIFACLLNYLVLDNFYGSLASYLAVLVVNFIVLAGVSVFFYRRFVKENSLL